MKDYNDDGTVDWLDELDVNLDPEMKMPKAFKVSSDCVDMVKHFEGFEGKAYYDPVGILTLGYGNTIGVREGDTITREEATKLLEDMLEKEYARYVRMHVKVPVTQAMFDSLTGFTYNLGVGNLANSTLLKKLNSGDYKGASQEFIRWDKAGGEVLAGLTRRRKAETAMFVGGNWTDYT